MAREIGDESAIDENTRQQYCEEYEQCVRDVLARKAEEAWDDKELFDDD